MLESVSLWMHANAVLIATRGAAAVAVLVVVGAVTVVAGRLIGGALRRKGPRGATLATIVKSVVTLTGFTAAVVMALSQIGINVATVLAGAGVIGLAVGFGAQTLVKDCISGFFLILDDVVQVGDTAQVDDKTGVIERVGLRVTQLRAASGQLWYLPNGTIAKVGNFNRGWNRAEVKVGLAYQADVGSALEVLQQVGVSWAKDNPDLALEPPVAQGVLELGDALVTIRLTAKIPAQKLWDVERDLRRRVKDELARADLWMASPRPLAPVTPPVAGADEPPPAAS